MAVGSSFERSRQCCRRLTLEPTADSSRRVRLAWRLRLSASPSASTASRTTALPCDDAHDPGLSDLERTLHREMPISVAMGMRAVAWRDRRLAIADAAGAQSQPPVLGVRGQPQRPVHGRRLGHRVPAAARRGLAGQHRDSPRRRSATCGRCGRREIVAQGLPLDPDGEAFFFELLRSKGRSKIDVAAEIADAEGPLVTFTGSYVVQD